MNRPEQAEQGERVDEGDFLHDHLQKQPAVTVAEAYRVILLVADGKDDFTSFAEREESLLARGFIRRGWNLSREQAIDRGSVAYMVCQVLRIRGGVNRETLGRLGVGERRYAVRELVHRDLLAPGAPYRYMTGSEIVDLAAKADAYMAEHGMYEQRADNLQQMLETGRPGTPASAPAVVQ